MQSCFQWLTSIALFILCRYQALAAEMTQAFSRRLESLGVVVKELTGDMQLTKRELEETQVNPVSYLISVHTSDPNALSVPL